MLEVNIDFDNPEVKGLNSRLIVKRDGKPSETEGGILLPDNQYVAPDWVTVLVTPNQMEDRFGKRPCPLERGMRVFVRPSAGQKLWEMDETIQIVHTRDVCAIDKDGEISAFDHWVIVQKDAQEETLSGGLIIIPEASRQQNVESEQQGNITSMGAQVKDLSLNDRVVFDSESALTIDKDKRLFVTPEDLILGVLVNG